MRSLRRLVLLAPVLCCAWSCSFPATMSAVRVKVVDAADETPISGAHVLFTATAHRGTLTGDGGSERNLFAAETVSTATGQIALAAQPFHYNGLSESLSNPQMVIVKPGYVVVVLQDDTNLFPDLRTMTSWQYQDRTVRLKRLVTDEELEGSARSASFAVDLAVVMLGKERAECPWQQIPRFLVAVDRLVSDWNARRRLHPDPARPYERDMRGPLQIGEELESVYGERGCGSFKEFMQPYL